MGHISIVTGVDRNSMNTIESGIVISRGNCGDVETFIRGQIDCVLKNGNVTFYIDDGNRLLPVEIDRLTAHARRKSHSLSWTRGQGVTLGNGREKRILSVG